MYMHVGSVLPLKLHSTNNTYNIAPTSVGFMVCTAFTRSSPSSSGVKGDSRVKDSEGCWASTWNSCTDWLTVVLK